MKPFNLEEAKAGKPVCTREGNKVRIVCFDCVDNNYPIIALVSIGYTEIVATYTKDGKHNCGSTEPSNNDLMMADVIHEGYINIYNTSVRHTGSIIYETEEQAKNCACDAGYLDTIKIQWKEYQI